MYLDYNAATPVDQRVVDVMNKMHTEHFANPSSAHDEGTDVADMLDQAREDLALTVGCSAMDVFFTSGATEANNLILYSFGKYMLHDCRILYGATEHRSVIEPCLDMFRRDMISIMPIPVGLDGTISPKALKAFLKDYPADLVSIMMANSETGVINPIRELAQVAHDAGAYLHSDITQAVGKIPVSIMDLGIDAATCSSHKMYGPKGCGALIATRPIRKTLHASILGGGQEANVRSGTENTPAIVGFGKACELIRLEDSRISEKIMMLRDNFESRMKKAVPDITINGETAERLPNTSNIRIKGVLADAVITNAKNIAISSGSACSSSAMGPSHVLLAMGLDETAADECIRVSIGKQNTMRDIQKAVEEIAKAAELARSVNSKPPVEETSNVAS